MRKQVLRSVREGFRRELVSDGKFSKLMNSLESTGADVYVWRFSRDLSFFVYLLPNPKSYHDSFMVELAWSSGEFPKNAALQHDQELNCVSDGRIRLPVLWREQWASAVEPWWELGSPLSAESSEEFYSEEETRRRLARVPETVTDALAKIKQYALPFFERIVSERELGKH
jgi:hypothetical protein